MGFYRRPQEVVHRLPLPKDDEKLGIVARALGASNFAVFCNDKLERVCIIPGRLKRRFWLKEGDLVLVKPWVVQSDKRGDVIWRYSIMDRQKLKEKGFTVPEL